MLYGAISTLDRFGSNKSAYQFDGIDDYISVGRMEFNTPLSISLWFMSDVVTEKWNTLIGWNNPNTDPEFEGMQIASDWNGDIIVRAGNRWDDFTLGQPLIGDGKWHHLVVTKSAIDTVKVYLDGQFVKKTFIQTNMGSGHPFYIGRSFQPDYKQEFYRGVMDDILIYKDELRERDVKILYHAGGWGL